MSAMQVEPEERDGAVVVRRRPPAHGVGPVPYWGRAGAHVTVLESTVPGSHLSLHRGVVRASLCSSQPLSSSVSCPAQHPTDIKESHATVNGASTEFCRQTRMRRTAPRSCYSSTAATPARSPTLRGTRPTTGSLPRLLRTTSCRCARLLPCGFYFHGGRPGISVTLQARPPCARPWLPGKPGKLGVV